MIPLPDETAEIRSMDSEFLEQLNGVLGRRLKETVEFGRSFSVEVLAEYLRELFGDELYFDSLISILQQYTLADAPLVAPTGRITGSTGFHLALFGPPGTGKTFSIDDLIRGNPRSGVPPHGLPGRNRYCGGITPVQFLRVGQSYTGRTFNFIVPGVQRLVQVSRDGRAAEARDGAARGQVGDDVRDRGTRTRSDRSSPSTTTSARRGPRTIGRPSATPTSRRSRTGCSSGSIR